MSRCDIKPIVTYNTLVEQFPSMKQSSKNIARKILPLHPSSELAQIAAALMADGHIDWYTSDGRPRTRKAILYSSKKEECEWFLGACNKLFGVSGRLIAYTPNHGFWKRQPYKAVINNAAVAMILVASGVPAGSKTNTPYLVPDWIMGGNMGIKAQFLRFFFNFEGSTPRRKGTGHSWQIAVRICKSPDCMGNGKAFLEQIKNLLSEFDVVCSETLRIDGVNEISKNPALHFVIANQPSLVNFGRHIGFYSDDKNRMMVECIMDIAKHGRIKSEELSAMLEETKRMLGTDKSMLSKISLVSSCRYTTRQVEHFRRLETGMPLDFVFALLKTTGKSPPENLPDYVKFLCRLSAPARP
jgi:hypothetical protein